MRKWLGRYRLWERVLACYLKCFLLIPRAICSPCGSRGFLLVAGLINTWTGTTGRFDSVIIFCFSLWRGLVLGTLGHQGSGFVATGIFVAIMHTWKITCILKSYYVVYQSSNINLKLCSLGNCFDNLGGYKTNFVSSTGKIGQLYRPAFQLNGLCISAIFPNNSTTQIT